MLADAPAGTGRAHLVGQLACLIASKLCAGASPAGALTIANRSVRTVVRRGEPPLLVSAFVAVVDESDGSLTYAAAGQNVAFIVQPNGTPRLLAPTAPELGLVDAPRVNVRRVFIQADETLVATTASEPSALTEIAYSVHTALIADHDPSDAAVTTIRGLTARDCATVVTRLVPRAA